MRMQFVGRVTRVASVITAIGLASTQAPAQGGPVFDLQPGIAVSDFVSVVEGTPSNTAFSLRFSTRFPTSRPWLTPVVGAVFFPYGTTENTIRNTDAPSLFFGNIFSLLQENKTSGWLSIEMPVLLLHAPGAGSSSNARAYGRDLVILPTLYLHAGTRMMRDFGSIWSRVRVFAQLEQVLTPNKDPESGNRDFFNPTATFGISLPMGGGRN